MASRRDLAINGRFLSQVPTGVQRVAREVTREIDRLVCEGDYPLRVRLYCQTDVAVADLDYRAIEVVPLSGGGGHRWEQIRLPRAVGGADLLCLGNTAPIACLLGRPRTAVMIHDLSYKLYPEAYSRAYRLAHGAMLPILLRYADPFITVSHAERETLTRMTGRAGEDILVAPNGGWMGEEPPVVGPPIEARGDGFVLYVGSLSRRKNFAGALAAAIRLAREDRVRSVFVGATPSMITSGDIDVPADVADLIDFVGQVKSDAAFAEYYRNARCLLMPSFYEGSGLPPIEAMQFGCPVVVSDIGALRERCGDAADYCDPDDVADIAAAVRRVIGDPARAATLVERGFERARLFSWRSQAKIILDSLAA